MGSGELGANSGPTQPLDRLLVVLLGGDADEDHCSTACFDAPREVGACWLSRFGQTFERVACEPWVPDPRGRLDELGQHEHGMKGVDGVGGHLVRGRQRLVVAGEAVVEDRGRPVSAHRLDALTLRWRPP